MSQLHWCPFGEKGKIALRHWKNRHQTDVPPRGFVWLIHGIGEHSGRYHEYASFLTHFGFDALMIDLPGHGLSREEGQLKELVDFPTMRRALYEAFAWARTQGPMSKAAAQAPWYLVGHSMGALLALTWILEGKAEGFAHAFAERAFVSAPPLKLRLPVPAWKKELAKNLQSLAPHLAIASGINSAHLSFDAGNIGRHDHDPLIHSHASPALFLSMEEAIQQVLSRPQDIEIPLMMAVGDVDPIVDADTLQEFASRLGTHRLFLRVPNAKHEILNERGRRAIFEASVQWLL
jgi:alpha-beta hydrolase superfamily lysophospholipase